MARSSACPGSSAQCSSKARSWRYSPRAAPAVELRGRALQGRESSGIVSREFRFKLGHGSTLVGGSNVPFPIVQTPSGQLTLYRGRLRIGTNRRLPRLPSPSTPPAFAERADGVAAAYRQAAGLTVSDLRRRGHGQGRGAGHGLVKPGYPRLEIGSVGVAPRQPQRWMTHEDYPPPWAAETLLRTRSDLNFNPRITSVFHESWKGYGPGSVVDALSRRY
ncbi:hypothetical protein SRABI26_03758 [Arthrobacter sp. Bi26]|nr:hypothetical protein SRABI26_03758 [Arthrobacter sp. Bi26]